MEARQLVEPDIRTAESARRYPERDPPLRIAFVAQPRDAIEATGPQRGSVASVTWELAWRLAERHDVTIYAPLTPGQKTEERSAENVLIRRIPRVLRRLHKAIDVVTSLVGAHPPYFATNAFFREYAAAIAEQLERDPPDIVHIQVCSQFIPAIRYAVPQARIVFHTHDELLTRLDPALMSRRLAMCDALVTCSDYVTNRWRERFSSAGARMHTVGNGVDLQRFQPRDADLVSVADPHILYVGRVSPEKGVHVLARAFERVLAEVPEARLSVIGSAGLLPSNQLALLDDDPQIAGLTEFYGRGVFGRVRKQLFKARNGYLNAIRASVTPATRARIDFHGPFEYMDLPALYRSASLLVAPSLCAEPFGLPLAEAMASGLPVVASRSGGMTAIVEHGRTGCLVERGDVSGLAHVIVSLLRDPEQLVGMRRASRLSAEARFGWNRAAYRLENIYTTLSGAP
jgi:glycosyltransferase involved in cell wall biosynthesis